MSDFTKRKILVLDDDKIQHLLFRKRVAILKIDIDLIFFEDALSALDFIAASPPHVVISDINLNKMDGWEFLEEIHGLGFNGAFYLLSGSIYPEDRSRATKDERVSGFFEKPIKESDLHYILGL
ncbi:response regulator [Algoriphagus boritolerans]|uniref:Response regulator receiver domain-containing protein n=2 Tax=Algoriphagus TaxID=246875 RepID=A0A1H5RPI4_9BACT|nr:response regulator [Algoriphagus boritolerans]SEF40236.1 Response regulator receiver domain-containing protein [Algoriphagus boritolerans DSM 17298 = JCM 18970]